MTPGMSSLRGDKIPGDIRVISMLAELLQYSGDARGGEKLLQDLSQQSDWKDKAGARIGCLPIII